MTWNGKSFFRSFVLSLAATEEIDNRRCGMLKRMEWLSGGVLLLSLVLICVPVMASATQQAGGPTDALGGAPTPYSSSSAPSPLRLRGHVPTKALAAAKALGELASDTQISMAIVLPLRNQAELQDLLGKIYNPVDPLYGHYLTPQEFTDRFGPTQADYDAVTAYARSLGLTITGTHPNRTLLDVSGSAGTVEAAFTLHLGRYQAPDGREFHAPDNDPEVPDAIASRIVGVVGLDNAAVWHAHNRVVSAAEMAQSSPLQTGTGPYGGLAPSDILTAYNLQGVAANGSGQTLGLFELDGYTPNDVASYVSYFGLPSVPLQKVLIDGFSGAAGDGSAEVTLDIELQIALAPGASKIIVYEGPNSNTGVIDTYNKIATDNLAKQISTSWGYYEKGNSSAFMNSENVIFQQMALQGQSIYAASGDSGAYDNGKSLSVDDPSSQPYVAGVGGTTLFVNPDETYSYETTWNTDNKAIDGAGGGGVSSIWPIPAWQQGIASAASATMRNVPDVSLNADPDTGYSVYHTGQGDNGWTVYGGTSCAAPLWAAFTARVNQQRAANGIPPLGFANPSIYQIATGISYGDDFHDITQGTNIVYHAGAGYDNATGWGSFNGADLLADLSVLLVPNAPTIGTAMPGNAQALVAFTAPAFNGSSPITSYTATSNPDSITGTGTTSPITVSGLTNGKAYTFTVTATSNVGTSVPSSPSNSVTPEPPIIINNGSPYTTKTTVSLALTYHGAAYMQFSTNNGTTWSAWVAYAATKNLTLPSGDGLKTVSVRFRDSNLVVSDIYSATITLDTKAPVNGTLTPTQLAGSQIKLDWTGFSDATSGISSYKLVRGATLPAASCTGTAIFTPSATDTTYTDTSSEQGMKYFYRLCAVDNAGNVSTGATTPAVMAIPEVNKPSGTVSINQGNYTNKAAVTLNLAASDAYANVAAYCISNTNTCTTWTKLPTPITPLSIPAKPWTLAAGADGNRTVTVWFKDVWGNVSDPASASTILDKTLPVNGNLTIDSTFNLSWNDFSDATSGIASYVLVRGTSTYPACSTASAVIYSGDQTSFNDSSNTNSGTTYYYRVCAVDNAGNMSTGATVSMKKP